MHKDRFIIKGLAGKKALKGSIQINGAKNAVLKAMAASVLFEDMVELQNVPDTEDVKKLSHLLTLAGMEVNRDVEAKTLKLDASKITSTDLDHETTKAMRSSIMLTGPMLARFGKVSFSMPGGCVIGPRPIDLYIDGYKKMGAKVEQKGERFEISVEGGKLKGAEIFFNMQTVGGTETLMMAAVLAKGKTVLKNCAMEPEIVSLAEYLVACGAEIKGIGTTTMEITGGSLLASEGEPYVTIPDRIETGSYLLLGALLADDLKIEKCNPAHVEVVVNMLRGSGVPIEAGKDFLHIKGNAKIDTAKLSAFNVRTHEYPGFPTDLQSPVVSYLSHVSGEAIVLETIFEGRFKYVQDLVRMGALITEMNPREILIRGLATDGAEGGVSAAAGTGGKTHLIALGKEEELQAHDIRAGFAVVMAALAAEGESVINSVYFIDRGYEKLEERLAVLGADIKRIKG